MHVSPAVRTLRDDPIEGERVTLLVEVADDYDPDGAPIDTVASELRRCDCEIQDRRRFGTLVVDAPQERLEEACAVEGIALVETDGVGTVDADGAGEDVEFDP